MSYQFSLEKKTLAVVTTVFVMVGVLLFSAGLLMGVHFGLGSATLVAANSQPSIAKPVDASPPTTIADQTIDRAGTTQENATRSINNSVSGQIHQPENSAQISSKTKDEVPNSDADADSREKLRDPLFWVQVGVFRSEQEAERLIYDLEDRGYEPAIYEGIDTDERIYFAVRIGSFNDREEAQQSALAFERKEKKRAIVRAINSL
jgi:cell division septation protein DedD